MIAALERGSLLTDVASDAAVLANVVTASKLLKRRR
jgi:hypothetical protein